MIKLQRASLMDSENGERRTWHRTLDAQTAGSCTGQHALSRAHLSFKENNVSRTQTSAQGKAQALRLFFMFTQ